jgi:hypothetical protein
MRKTLCSSAVLLGLLGAGIGTEVLCHHRTVPPSGLQTLDGYLSWRPNSDRFLIHSIGGKEFLEALGPGGGVLPSGPAGYVFDRSGRMVDWTHDSGDDSGFQQKWRSPGKRRDASRSEATQWAQGATRPG